MSFQSTANYERYLIWLQVRGVEPQHSSILQSKSAAQPGKRFDTIGCPKQCGLGSKRPKSPSLQTLLSGPGDLRSWITCLTPLASTQVLRPDHCELLQRCGHPRQLQRYSLKRWRLQGQLLKQGGNHRSSQAPARYAYWQQQLLSSNQAPLLPTAYRRSATEHSASPPSADKKSAQAGAPAAGAVLHQRRPY